ncbi:hypothetical protein BX661DRAFT_225721 [Kickxella alabastrina]|uniref:uncharacterized protein n=1 Tax=Kickxella alabastrina TaxID=61397 RepID=UPI00221E45BD|nr:uncharacterized protein BX661DRAFT_225721 [Kickxella alabastrina]KAI7824472.1 hypothetical protein BX661DRAFT_225721 [Kickxella alabastrina]
MLPIQIFSKSTHKPLITNARYYTTTASSSTAASNNRNRPKLSFQQFVQRGKVLEAYRKYMRLTKRITDKPSRKEMRAWIRVDFDRYKDQTDPQRIDVLLAQATRQYKEMESGMFSMI